MKKKWMIKLVVCVIAVATVSYEHLYEINQLTAKRMMIPSLEQEIALMNEEIDEVNFAFQTVENPIKLLKIAKNPDYSGLKFPLEEDLVILTSTDQSILESPVETQDFHIHVFKLSVILGAH